MKNAGQQSRIRIAPHYYKVAAQFERLADKLAEVRCQSRRPVRGTELVDGSAALALWQHALQKTSRRLPPIFRRLSSTILRGRTNLGQAQILKALVPLEQEVNGLVALHRQLHQNGLSGRLSEGQQLLAACAAKVATDLDDIFAFFCRRLRAAEEGASLTRQVWTGEIACHQELAAFRRWQQQVAGSSASPSLLTGLVRFSQQLIARGATRAVACWL